MRIKIMDDLNEIRQVLIHPKLFKLSGFTETVDEFMPEPDLYLGAYTESGQIMGLCKFSCVTNITWEVHINILPEFQRKESIKIAHEIIKWLQENTNILNIVTYVPIECKHVFRFINKLRFKETGIINNGIIYNYKLQDLYLFQLTIR